MQIGISGSTGYLGTRLRRRLRPDAGQVVSLTRRDPGDGSDFVHFELETGIAGAVPPLHRVAHLAAFVPSHQDASSCLECESLNGGGTLRLLEALDRSVLQVFVNASSCHLWNPAEEGLILDPYQGSKRSAEMLVDAYAHRYEFAAIHLRLPHVYGPGMARGGMIEVFLRRALDGEPLEIFNEGRDRIHLTYCDDAVDAMVAALGSEGVSGAFDIGPREPVSVLEIARAILEVTDSRSEIVARPGGPRSVELSLDPEPALEALELGSYTPLQTGLAATLDQAREALA